MKFRSMFQVRKPGNGAKVEGKFDAARKDGRTFPSKDNSQNSGPKQPIK